jgi:GntR family transcriptional regulator, trigonelline degradation regulator
MRPEKQTDIRLLQEAAHPGSGPDTEGRVKDVTDMQVQRHAPIREQVVTILRQAIVDMRLKPGELIIERQLCEMTSASRPSVREALRQLEAEGLVESRNGRGTYISTVSRDVAKDVYAVREVLEGLAARLFAEGASYEDREELRRSVDTIARIAGEGGDSGELLAAKEQFYDVLFRGSGNKALRQVVEGLHRRVTQLRAMSLGQPGRAAETVKEITAIADAIDRCDGEAAQAACALHVRRAAATILRALDAQSSQPPQAPPQTVVGRR